MGGDPAQRPPLRPDGSVDIDRIWEEGTLLDEAMQRAFREAIRQHEFSGVPMVFWRDGKIIEMPAAEVRAGLPENAGDAGGKPV